MLMIILKILFIIPVWLFFPTLFKGKKNLPKGKSILVCNHTSNIDVVLIEISSWRKKYYLAKKELFKKKFSGGFLKMLGTISIDRGKTDLTAMKESIRILNKGKILVMFPEGTRNKTAEDLGDVKAGAALFAIKTKAPIVPVWIKKKPKLFCPNVVRYGKPFTLEEYYDKKLDSKAMEECGKLIAEKLLENKIEIKNHKK